MKRRTTRKTKMRGRMRHEEEGRRVHEGPHNGQVLGNHPARKEVDTVIKATKERIQLLGLNKTDLGSKCFFRPELEQGRRSKRSGRVRATATGFAAIAGSSSRVGTM